MRCSRKTWPSAMRFGWKCSLGHAMNNTWALSWTRRLRKTTGDACCRPGSGGLCQIGTAHVLSVPRATSPSSTCSRASTGSSTPTAARDLGGKGSRRGGPSRSDGPIAAVVVAPDEIRPSSFSSTAVLPYAFRRQTPPPVYARKEVQGQNEALRPTAREKDISNVAAFARRSVLYRIDFEVGIPCDHIEVGISISTAASARRATAPIEACRRAGGRSHLCGTIDEK